MSFNLIALGPNTQGFGRKKKLHPPRNIAILFKPCLFSFCNIPKLAKWASLVAQMVKNLPAQLETWVQSLGWKGPLEEGMATVLQYSCLENPHGQRRLAGYSPQGRKELDTTERLSTHTQICKREE